MSILCGFLQLNKEDANQIANDRNQIIKSKETKREANGVLNFEDIIVCLIQCSKTIDRMSLRVKECVPIDTKPLRVPAGNLRGFVLQDRIEDQSVFLYSFGLPVCSAPVYCFQFLSSSSSWLLFIPHNLFSRKVAFVLSII